MQPQLKVVLSGTGQALVAVSAAMGNRNEAYYACPAVAGGSSAAPADAADNVANNDDAAEAAARADNDDDDDDDASSDATLHWSRFFAAVATRLPAPAASFSLSLLTPASLFAFPSPYPCRIPFGLASWHLKTFYARRALG